MSEQNRTYFTISKSITFLDRNGRLIGSVNKQAEEEFKAVTGNLEDLPF